jgi:dolichol-phosphate mannosyltransferase
MKIMDPTAGFICYTSKVLETLNLDSIRFIGYAFQIEMKFNSWKYGFDIVEVPIIFTDRTKGASKMSRGIFKEAILGVISLKINSFFKRYIPKNQVPK